MHDAILIQAIIDIGIDPVLLRVGPVAVHWYGLMYVVGLSVGMMIAIPNGVKLGISREVAYELFWPLLIACLVGGRLYYVVQSDFGWYLQHPQNIVATWEGGMAFYGAIFLGVPMAYVLARRKGLPFARLLDGITPLIPVAQAFGRIGNLINGDIVGYPSSLPWATRYTNLHNTFVPSHAVAYDPASAYELLLSVALFVVVWKVRFNFRVPGTVFALWVVLYSIGQFGLFFLRVNPIVLLGLKQAQITALVCIAVTIPVWMLWRSVYLKRMSGGGSLPERAGQPEVAGANG